MVEPSKTKPGKIGKTVIKLKIPAPDPSLNIEMVESEKGDKKKKKVKIPSKKQESPPPKEKKKIKKKKETKGSKKQLKEGLKVKVSNGKILRYVCLKKQSFFKFPDTPEQKIL